MIKSHMTTKEEIVSMKKDITTMTGKIDNLDSKLDKLTDKLLNPDTGVTARVNRNTAMRKVLVKAMWVIYTITIGAIIKIFTD